MVGFREIRVWNTKESRKQKILDRTKEKGDIIFGARSIQKRIGVFSRPTVDFDIFTKQPKASAIELEGDLDKGVGFDYFYSKKGVHEGTWKVKGRGPDFRKGTKDDTEVVDYSKIPKPMPEFTKINGIKYRKLSEEKKAKRKALKDPQFKFRHKKDREDLNRIKFKESFGKLPKIQVPKLRI